jgi:hypothetical protein
MVVEVAFHVRRVEWDVAWQGMFHLVHRRNFQVVVPEEVEDRFVLGLDRRDLEGACLYPWPFVVAVVALQMPGCIGCTYLVEGHRTCQGMVVDWVQAYQVVVDRAIVRRVAWEVDLGIVGVAFLVRRGEA